MEFLPKKMPRRASASSTESLQTAGDERKIRRAELDSSHTLGLEKAAQSNKSSVRGGTTSQTDSSARVWLIFGPTVLLSALLIAGFQTGILDDKQCALGVALALTFHSIGALLQRILGGWVAWASVPNQVLRAAIPSAVAIGLFFWVQPSILPKLYEELLKVGMAIVAIGAISWIVSARLANWLGKSGIVALRLACCIYLGFLYVGSFLVKAQSLAISMEGAIALVLVTAICLHVWMGRTSIFPIQIASVTYTIALWSSQGAEFLAVGLLRGAAVALALAFGELAREVI